MCVCVFVKRISHFHIRDEADESRWRWNLKSYPFFFLFFFVYFFLVVLCCNLQGELVILKLEMRRIQKRINPNGRSDKASGGVLSYFYRPFISYDWLLLFSFICSNIPPVDGESESEGFIPLWWQNDDLTSSVIVTVNYLFSIWKAV